LAGLTAVNLWSWLRRTPSNADRVNGHRELLRLEASGLLIRQPGPSGRRTTHVRLTETGWQTARHLLAEQNALDNDAEPFDIEDIPMLPLDWPMEAQAEPGEPDEPTRPGESTTPPSSPTISLAGQNEPGEAVASSSPTDIPPTAYASA